MANDSRAAAPGGDAGPRRPRPDAGRPEAVLERVRRVRPAPAQREPVVPSGAVCAWSLSLTLPQMTDRRLEGGSDSLRSQVAMPAAA